LLNQLCKQVEDDNVSNGRSITKLVQLISIPVLICASACSVVTPNISGPFDQNSPNLVGIQRHLYAGVGFGPSDKDPDASENSIQDVNDRASKSNQLTLGFDVSQRLSAEIHTANLRNDSVESRDEISYRLHGASALIYAGKNRHNFKRRGFTGFGRLGLGVLHRSRNGNIEYQQDNSIHPLIGAGLEFMFPFSLGLRAEALVFNGDTRYAQLALIYRAGLKEERRSRIELK